MLGTSVDVIPCICGDVKEVLARGAGPSSWTDDWCKEARFCYLRAVFGDMCRRGGSRI